MRVVARTIAALWAAALLAQPGLPGGLAAVGVVIAGALASAAIAGALSPLAIGLGALGALAFAALRPTWPIAAAAVLGTLLFAARAVRARDLAGTITHLGIAALAGAGAGYVVLRFGAAGDVLVRGVALAMASLVLSVPFAAHAEDPRVVALARLARQARGPARMRLLRAAALRRRAVEGSIPLGRTDRRRMERAMATILRLAEARHDEGGGGAGALDRALGAHVGALVRWTRAHRARWASGEALGADAREIEAATERLATEAAALDEMA